MQTQARVGGGSAVRALTTLGECFGCFPHHDGGTFGSISLFFAPLTAANAATFGGFVDKMFGEARRAGHKRKQMHFWSSCVEVCTHACSGRWPSRTLVGVWFEEETNLVARRWVVSQSGSRESSKVLKWR